MKTSALFSYGLFFLSCVILLLALFIKFERLGGCPGDMYACLGEGTHEHQQAALNGNADMALSLAYYYALVKKDFQHAAYWKKLAAEKGNQAAMESYGSSLSQDSDPKRRQEGIDWFEKARHPASASVRVQ